MEQWKKKKLKNALMERIEDSKITISDDFDLKSWFLKYDDYFKNNNLDIFDIVNDLMVDSGYELLSKYIYLRGVLYDHIYGVSTNYQLNNFLEDIDNYKDNNNLETLPRDVFTIFELTLNLLKDL